MNRQIFFKIAVTSVLIFSCLNFNSYGADNEKILTLEDAIGIAIQNNPKLGLSKADLSISKSKIRDAKSNYYPHIESKIVVPFIGRESGFFLDQLIWDFGRTSSKVKSSEYEYDASKYNYQKILNDIIQNTKTAYFKALIAKNKISTANKNIEIKELILSKIQELYRIERSSNLELTKANSDLEEAKLELINAKNKLALSKLNLIKIMGIDDDIDFDLVDYKTVNFVDYNLDETIEKAINNSNELKNLQAQQVALKSRLSASKSEFFPIIFGRTAYRFEGEGAEDSGADTPAFIAGVGIKFPIFLGFSRFAKVDEASAKLRKSQIELHEAKQRISSDVKKLFLDLKFSREKIQVAKLSKEVAENNLKLIDEKLALGRASKIDFVDAEAFYISINAKYLDAIYNYKIAETKFKKIIGELNQ